MSNNIMTNLAASTLAGRDRLSFDQVHALLDEMQRVDAESVDIQWLPHSTMRAQLSRDDEESFAWVGTISAGGSVSVEDRVSPYDICPKCHGAGERIVNRSRDGDPQCDEPVPCDCNDGEVIL